MKNETINTSSHHTILELKGSNLQILIPDNYTQIPNEELNQEALAAYPNAQFFRKHVSNSDNCILAYTQNIEQSMDFDDVEGLIDDIHTCMSEQQGIIEAKAGITKRGYLYIYSIVKTVRRESLSVLYYLRMNLRNNSDIIEINASFEECGTTGIREALSSEFARRAGLSDIFKEGRPGWVEDPYDPSYKKGCPMVLAEREGIDGLFPEHPLSQARELIYAVINDELIDDSDDSEIEDDNKTNNQSESINRDDEQAFCRGLFENRCRRYTKTVSIN